MMLPSSPQLPPNPVEASHKTAGAPPSTESFFNLLASKNATDCPSGQKKGEKTPSVPATSVALD